MAENNDEDTIAGLLQRYQNSALKRLESTGSVETNCGSLDVRDESISFASDPGCETFNDDFIAVWRPNESGSVRWAAAVADGVTGSLLAQDAAELACYAGLAAIAKANDGHSAASGNPMAFVTRIFHQIGRRILAAPDQFVPPDCPKSVWKVAAREGKFLQTTLNLIWSTEDGLRVMAIGDGGLLYSLVDTPTQFATHTFGAGKLQCIGPRSATVEPEAYLLPNWSRFACYTDGLAEAVAIMSELPTMMFDPTRNVGSVIERLNIERPGLINDNLSAFCVARVDE